MAVGERGTVSANDGVSSEISAMRARKMAKYVPVWTLSNAFTRAQSCTPKRLARARRTRVKVTFWRNMLTNENARCGGVQRACERSIKIGMTNASTCFQRVSFCLFCLLLSRSGSAACALPGCSAGSCSQRAPNVPN